MQRPKQRSVLGDVVGYAGLWRAMVGFQFEDFEGSADELLGCAWLFQGKAVGPVGWFFSRM